MLRIGSLSAVLATTIGLAFPAVADVPAPQVAIDVRIVIASDNFMNKIGVDFNFHVDAMPASLGSPLPILIGVPNNPPAPDPVNLLSRDPQAQILYSPSITVRPNESAGIFVSGEVPYADLFPGRPAAGAPSNVPFGIKLDIVPAVGPNGQIVLDISPHVTEFGEDAAGPAPGLVDRSIKTTVTVPDGGTVVIAGLFTSETRQTGAKIPVLRDLPVLGTLFRAPAGQPDHRDLLIFVTPHIVGDEDGGGGGGGVATVAEPTTAQDAATTTGPKDTSPTSPGQGGIFNDFFTSIFTPPCTHPTKPCEAHRRVDAPGNYPRGSERRHDHHPDGDKDQEQE